MIRCRNRFAWAFPLALVLFAADPAAAALLVVDRSHPNARDDGAGSAQQPLRTLREASRRIKAGDVLRVAPGVYRESLDLRQSDIANAPEDAAPTVIEGADGGASIIKGSDLVDDWESLGNGRYVRRDWGVNSQQVFVDGQALRQIGGTIYNGYPVRDDHPMAQLHAGAGGIWPGRTEGDVDDMPYGSFYYDEEHDRLYVRVHHDSLEGHQVEASVRPFLVLGEGVHNLTLRDLSFRHANTTDVAQSGAVSLRGDGIVLERLDIQHVDGAGIDITGDRNVIRGVNARHCGQLGIKARGRHARITGNDVSFNNTRGFNKWWEAGGAKFVGQGGLKESVVSGNRAVGNAGDGIWFDWMNENNRIENNVAAYNSGFGIHYEASKGALLVGNRVFGNKQRGIYLANSRDSTVRDNIVVRNGLGGIVSVDARKGSHGSYDLRPRNSRVLGNIVAWNDGPQIIIPETIDDGPSRSDYNLIVTQPGKSPSFSQGWGSRSQPKRIGLAAWRKASGQDQGSAAIAMAIPDEIEKALHQQDTNPDWSVLLKERHRIAAPPAVSATQSHEPGKEGFGS